MNVVPEGRAKQKSNKFPSIWYQPTVFVFSPNPEYIPWHTPVRKLLLETQLDRLFYFNGILKYRYRNMLT